MSGGFVFLIVPLSNCLTDDSREKFQGLGCQSELIQDAFGYWDQKKGMKRLDRLPTSLPRLLTFKNGMNVTIFGHELRTSPALNRTIQKPKGVTSPRGKGCRLGWREREERPFPSTPPDGAGQKSVDSTRSRPLRFPGKNWEEAAWRGRADAAGSFRFRRWRFPRCKKRCRREPLSPGRAGRVSSAEEVAAVHNDTL